MLLAHQIPDFNNFVQACSLFIYTFYMAELGLVMSGKIQIFNQIIHQTCNMDILRFRNLSFCTGVLIKLKGFYVPNDENFGVNKQCENI